MIISNDNLDSKCAKVKYFQDTTSLVSLVNTEGELGIVLYLINNVWQPYNIAKTSKVKIKGKTNLDLINNLPPISIENIANVKGKFYNTFDTPIEINSAPITSIYNVDESARILTRNTYYLITDVQELERTFNSNIMPCNIVNCNQIVNTINDKIVDESLIYLVENYLIK